MAKSFAGLLEFDCQSVFGSKARHFYQQLSLFVLLINGTVPSAQGMAYSKILELRANTRK